MKKLFTASVLILYPLLLLAGSHQYQIGSPQLDPDGDLTRVSFPTSVITGAAGAPQVPAWPVRLLLPQGEQAVDVTITYAGRVDLPGVHTLPPIQQQYPMTEGVNAVITQPDPAIYQLDQFFPNREVLYETTEFLCGHGILLAQAHPVRYNPVTGELFYYSEFTVNWNGATTREVRSLRERVSNRIEQMVDNPRELRNYSYLDERPDTEDYDYAIVTAPPLADSFQPLVDFKNSLGIVTRMHDIFDILDEYDGADDADRLRNFIINEYEEHGISYLLLAGDIEFVPYRSLYVSAGGNSDHLPSDLFFTGLDGSWNNDNDGRWGEAGEEDWYAEIHVGRASVSNSTEADNFVNKQLSYQQTPVIADLESYLMIGENLDSVPTWGGDCKDQIVDGSTAHGINTAGIPENIELNYLYDRNSYWSISQLFSQLGNGINVTNHLGHCNWNYAMKMSNPDVNNGNFTSNGINHNFHIGYSQGCIPGAFEYSDCIVERMTNLENGYACFVANSRYGWYQPGGSGASSQLYDREFFDALNGEGIHRIGSTNQDAKEDMINWASGDVYMRWVHYELNLFGDPTLSIWTSTPLEQDLTYPTVLVTGMPQMELTLMSAGEPLAGALAALTRNGVLYGRATTDAAGEAVIVFDEVIIPGEYDLMISGNNLLPTAWELEVIAPVGPYLTYNSHAILDGDFNSNSQVEAGETVDMQLELHNYGTEDATGITAVISTDNPQITIVEAATGFDPIVPEGDNVCLTPFVFSADSDCVDGTLVDFDLTITSNEGEWNSSFQLTVHAPLLASRGLRVVDEANSQLDPGETRDVTITVLNEGGGLLTGVTSLLTLTDQYVTIDQNSCELAEVAPGETADLCFTMTASTDTPVGHTVSPAVAINGDLNYTTDFTVSLVVGLTVDGFETGDYSGMDWVMSGNADWIIDDGNAWEGAFCARSGNISDYGQTQISFTGYVVEAGEISFAYKVSSEGGYDFLRFYIDGDMQLNLSGNVSWMNQSFPVTVGEHTFSWRYHKDGGEADGDDCGWVDYIIFPQLGLAPQPLIEVDQTGFALEVANGGSLEESLTISNAGEAPLEYELAFMDAALSYYHDMEADETGWEHAADSDDPWHLTDHDWSSDNHSWYLGEEGSWQYGNNLHCWLETPPFDVAEDATLYFWHRMDLEVFNETFALDAGIIEISANGGDTWSQVLPVGGYPYHYEDEDGGPFNYGRPCFSGQVDWEQVQVNLNNYAGQTLQFRWRFGSGASGTAEGWYIDDVTIGSYGADWLTLTPAAGSVDPAEAENVAISIDAAGYSDTLLSGMLYLSSNDPLSPELMIPVAVEVGTQDVTNTEPHSFYLAQNYPNPFNPITMIDYGLQSASEVKLVLFNTLGQQVRTLATGWQTAGHHQVMLDGSSLSSGMYFYRLEAGDLVAVRKMVLVK